MFLKKIAVLCLLSAAHVIHAQESDFCDAVMTISRDAPNDFRNIRGALAENGLGVSVWVAGIKVPGGIAAQFVSSMGLFYECALLQSKKKEDLGPVYDRYKKLLSDCLQPAGYELMQQPNFYPGLEGYKKLVYMPKENENSKEPPSHATLEATYNKDVGLYTVVLYIFRH